MNEDRERCVERTLSHRSSSDRTVGPLILDHASWLLLRPWTVMFTNNFSYNATYSNREVAIGIV